MIQVRHLQSPWTVIVEPDADAMLLVVVTVYEVPEWWLTTDPDRTHRALIAIDRA
jgi:hypothetical protein